MKTFLRKNWTTLALLALLALLLIPQTGTPIKVVFNRMLSFSPSEVPPSEQNTLTDYNWQLQDLQGDFIQFDEADGNVSFVNIWATWCPPCIAEMPSMQSLYDRYGQEVSFYFVSLETPEIIQNFVAERGYSFPVYTTQDSFPPELQTQSYPTTYLISKKGKIVIHKIGAANWDSSSVHKTIDGLLAE